MRASPVCACAGRSRLRFHVALPVPSLAARLGSPYYVDDAEIGRSAPARWGRNSSAGNGDALPSSAPPASSFGSPVELGTNLVNTRSDGGAFQQSRGQGGAAADRPRLRVGAVRRAGLTLSTTSPTGSSTSRDIRLQQGAAAQYQCRRPGRRDPAPLRNGRRGRLLEFHETVECRSEVFA